MTVHYSSFPLTVDTQIRVPPNVIRQKSANAKEHPETPDYFLLGRKDKKGHRYFLENEHTRGKDENRGGFRLFVPAMTKTGDLLVIQWVADSCACALLAAEAEAEMCTTPEPGLTATATMSADGAW